MVAAMARASLRETDVCDRSRVKSGKSSVVGSQPGAYGVTSRPRARSGNMFSTAKRTSVSSAICWIPPRNCRAYSRCHRNGGCTTTVCAPHSSAASLARTSLAHGSVPQTRWVMTRHGACSARIGISW